MVAACTLLYPVLAPLALLITICSHQLLELSVCLQRRVSDSILITGHAFMDITETFGAVPLAALRTLVIGDAGPSVDHMLAVRRWTPLVLVRVFKHTLLDYALFVLYHRLTGDQMAHFVLCRCAFAILRGTTDRNAIVIDLALHVRFNAVGMEDVRAVIE